MTGTVISRPMDLQPSGFIVNCRVSEWCCVECICIWDKDVNYL